MTRQARAMLWIAWNVVYLGGAVAGIVYTLMYDRKLHGDYAFHRWSQWLIVYLAVGFFANKAIRTALHRED